MERSRKPAVVNADQRPPQPECYLCPDEHHAISRAVHLGRLAAFYPACRQCPRRGETGTLSPRRVAQLAETSGRGRPRSLFHEEGAGGVYLNDLSPAAAMHIAAAFASVVKEENAGGETRREGDEERGRRSNKRSADADGLVSQSPPHPLSPSILLAGDARPLTAELLAAAAEGLRSSGCNVVDIGPSTAPCLAFAVGHLQAAGGLLLGNPGEDSHTVGMKFWFAGPRPLSIGGSLEPIVERYEAGREQPARVHGQLCRYEADRPYLARIAERYHALRPLRVVVDSASRPTLDFLQRLAATVACEIIPSRTARSGLPRQILADAAHFAACIDGDGESCRVFDEQGRPVPAERLLLLLASGAAPPGAAVLEAETSPVVADRLESVGIRVTRSSPRRADMAAAMIEHAAVLGGGPSSRFWYCEAGLPLCDALMTVTRLLVALSQGDAALSQLLDRHARFG
jgi:phosphomannomutase